MNTLGHPSVSVAPSQAVARSLSQSPHDDSSLLPKPRLVRKFNPSVLLTNTSPPPEATVVVCANDAGCSDSNYVLANVRFGFLARRECVVTVIVNPSRDPEEVYDSFEGGGGQGGQGGTFTRVRVDAGEGGLMGPQVVVSGGRGGKEGGKEVEGHTATAETTTTTTTTTATATTTTTTSGTEDYVEYEFDLAAMFRRWDEEVGEEGWEGGEGEEKDGDSGKDGVDAGCKEGDSEEDDDVGPGGRFPPSTLPPPRSRPGSWTPGLGFPLHRPQLHLRNPRNPVTVAVHIEVIPSDVFDLPPPDSHAAAAGADDDGDGDGDGDDGDGDDDDARPAPRSLGRGHGSLISYDDYVGVWDAIGSILRRGGGAHDAGEEGKGEGKGEGEGEEGDERDVIEGYKNETITRFYEIPIVHPSPSPSPSPSSSPTTTTTTYELKPVRSLLSYDGCVRKLKTVYGTSGSALVTGSGSGTGPGPGPGPGPNPGSDPTYSS